MTDNDGAESTRQSNRELELSLSEDEALYLWSVMKREMADGDQSSDERDVVMSLHAKVHDVVRSRHD